MLDVVFNSVGGATYKKDCEDLRESPAIKIVSLLVEDGYNVTHYDPLVESMTYPSLEEIIRETDLAVILVGHGAMIKELNEKRTKLGDMMREDNFIIFDE